MQPWLRRCREMHDIDFTWSGTVVADLLAPLELGRQYPCLSGMVHRHAKQNSDQTHARYDLYQCFNADAYGHLAARSLRQQQPNLSATLICWCSAFTLRRKAGLRQDLSLILLDKDTIVCEGRHGDSTLTGSM